MRVESTWFFVCACALAIACGGHVAARSSGVSGSGGDASTPDAGGADAGTSPGGCRGGAETPSDAGTAGSGDCSTIASAICHRLDACGWGFDGCVAGETLRCRADTTGPGTAVMPEEYGACARGFAALDCADLYDFYDSDVLVGLHQPAGCHLRGTRADGLRCSSNAQCRGGYCDGGGFNRCGTCATPGARGAPCSFDEECGEGLVCLENVCAPPVGLGGCCDQTWDYCAQGLVCVNSRCAEPGGLGKPCSGGFDCVEGLACKQNVCAVPTQQGQPCVEGDCAAGLACNEPCVNITTPTPVCVPVTVAQPAQACGCLGSAIADCVGFCVIPGQASGICTAPAADGAACDDYQGPTCVWPAQCVGGICQLPDAAACG
jgi:hypothetical protein